MTVYIWWQDLEWWKLYSSRLQAESRLSRNAKLFSCNAWHASDTHQMHGVGIISRYHQLFDDLALTLAYNEEMSFSGNLFWIICQSCVHVLSTKFLDNCSTHNFWILESNPNSFESDLDQTRTCLGKVRKSWQENNRIYIHVLP